jgi:heme ABC exporter ATP-binding subunit CcmA
MDAPLIEAHDLSKIFTSSPVLRRVNLRVESGSIAIIIGGNGAGKSTLLKILAGLTPASAGEVLLFGRPSAKLGPNLRRRVALATHQSFLYPNLTARENLEFTAGLYGLARIDSEITGWLDRVGLSSVANERLRTFSRGMEQRLGLARALLPAPDVLLMDEPFAALDGEGVALVVELLKAALNRRCAIVITTHAQFILEGIRFDSYEIVRGRLVAFAEDHRRSSVRALQAR